MKSRISIIISLLLISFSVAFGSAQLKKGSMNKVLLTKNDVPVNFMYGKIPGFAQKVLKNNPWMLDKKAIRKLAPRIYPGGNFKNINSIHMTIMAKKGSPYSDDIVCYVILYKDISSARREMNKLTEFVGYNSDRAIVMTHRNMAVYLHVDKTVDYHYIRNMSEKIQNKIGSL